MLIFLIKLGLYTSVSDQPRPEASADWAPHTQRRSGRACAPAPLLNAASPFVSSFPSVRATQHRLCGISNENSGDAQVLCGITGVSQDMLRAKGDLSDESYGAERNGGYPPLPHTLYSSSTKLKATLSQITSHLKLFLDGD